MTSLRGAEGNQRDEPESDMSNVQASGPLWTCWLRAYDLPVVVLSTNGLPGAHSSIEQ